MDELVLSRIQFAANITFHIIFPSINIALAWFLLFVRFMQLRTGEIIWRNVYKFWVKIFALCFALGVVSGITMSFQFGTNWPGFMERVGNIAGPLLAYEVLTAFFLEAGFIGIMLFGQERVSPKMHLFATFLVAFGTTLSAFWILALNSWMHTPAGYEVVDGVYYPQSWWEIIFNPSMHVRFPHMLLASFLTTAFLVAGLSAYKMLRGCREESVLLALRLGVKMAAVIIPLQIFVGDMHGLNTLAHQPAKIAAIEAVWETESPVPLTLIGIPSEEEGKTLFALKVPYLGSLILTHSLDGEIKGISEFANVHPPVAPVFFGFRVMVGIGLLMLLVSWYSYYQMHKGRGLSVINLQVLVVMTFAGVFATIAGWYVTEIGRQPFLVYGILRTSDAHSNVTATEVGISLVTYLSAYVVLLTMFVSTVFYLARKHIEILAGDLK